MGRSDAEDDLRPGRDIPGYTGHIPRKDVEGVHGTTFRHANALASSYKDLPAIPSPSLADPAVRRLARGAAGGYVQDDPTARFYSLGHRGGPQNHNSQVGIGPIVKTASDEEKPPAPSRPLSPGYTMPGYTGHVPKVAAQNIIGSTFRRANERAAFGDSVAVERQTRRCGSPKGSPMRGDIADVPRKKRIGVTDHIKSLSDMNGQPPIQRSVSCKLFDGFGFPYGREKDGEIPSFIDHVPRKAAASMKSEEGFGCPFGREVTAEIPSYIEHVPRKSRKGRPEYLQAQWDSINQPRPREEPSRDEPDAAKSPAARSASPRMDRQAIPGYSGHVRKVAAENVFGVSFKIAGACADGEGTDDVKYEHPWLGSPNVHARSHGRSIPGYSGYIPKKGPDGVLGATFKSANERAADGFDPVLEAKSEATRLQEERFQVEGSLRSPTSRPTRQTTGKKPEANGEVVQARRPAWR
mmetsp:Transcript_81031/g.127619  ORF Transcript_81031/g.127619 Transcript_81031/m.127619 type:complete len:467 (-) Transcript_81031:8-1408(-)